MDEVCKQIRGDAKLAAGYNAVGLSQGALLLRGVVERCGDRPDQPPMKNLILAGGPNMGIMELPGAACPQPENWHPLFLKVACVVAQHALSLTSYHIRGLARHVMPGQYFRDTTAFSTYKKDSRFLADLNNEMGWKNPAYKANLETLDSLTLLKFNQDQVVNPRESAWFESYSKKEKRMLSLREQDLYKEDFIGLRALDEAGKITFLEKDGKHMEFNAAYAEEHFFPVLGLGPGERF